MDSGPQLFVLGFSHHTTPLEVRERLAVPEEEQDALLARLRETSGCEELFLLNTCNRIELYGVASQLESRGQIINAFLQERALDPKLFFQHGFSRLNHEMVQHLLEVSSGLDSQMVGEAEIFGQVKSTWQKAREKGTLGPRLDRLLQKAFQATKWIRTHSNIGRGQVTIGQVATELACRIFDKLEQVSVLVLGSGEVAERTLQSLQGRGASHFIISSRRLENAQTLAHRFAGAATEFIHFPRYLSDVDIVIASTSAPGFILHREMLQAAQKHRPHRPLFLLDLALPRDIDPAVSRLPNVYLYNLDDLAGIANENLKARQAEVDHCRTLLSNRSWELWLNLRRREFSLSRELSAAADSLPPRDN
jgi:glutamyl-tRNA reductase